MRGSKAGALRRALSAAALAVTAMLAIVPAVGATSYVQTGVIGSSNVQVSDVAVDQSNGSVYLARSIVPPFDPGHIARFDSEGIPLSPATMGSGIFLGVAVDPSSQAVYANTAIFGNQILGFDQAGDSLGSPFPFNLPFSPVGKPDVGSNGQILLPIGLGGDGMRNVTAYSPATGEEIETIVCSSCPAPAGFGAPNAVSVDGAGNIYVADKGGSGNERQSVVIGGEPTEGTFELSFEGESTSATGTGDLSNGSETVTNVNTSTGQFVAGKAISGADIPAGTTITAVGEGTLTLSQQATADATGVALSAGLPLDISDGGLQAALAALPSLGVGNVKVPSKSGTLPEDITYSVFFEGTLAETDVPQLMADSSGLSGGMPAVTVDTTAVGGSFPSRLVKLGPLGDEDPAPPVVLGTGNAQGVAVNPANGHVFVSGDDGSGWHITEYDPSGDEVSDFGLGGFQGSESPQLAVNEATGVVYATDATPSGVGFAIVFTPVPSPEATTEAATEVGSSKATLNGKVDPNGVLSEECRFEYTTKADFEANGFTGADTELCDPEPGEETDPVSVSAEVTGLSPKTAYVFRVVEATEGGTAEGGELEFTTTAPAPKATTEAASGISQTKATLNAKVDAEGADASCEFEYGTSVAYGSKAACSLNPVTGTALTAVSAAISGLSPSTTYHYRVVAQNAGGKTQGTDLTFTTSADTCETNAALCPPPPKKENPPPPPPPGGDKAALHKACLGKAKAAFRKAQRAARKKKGKVKARAMKAANKARAKAIKRCNQQLS